MRKMASPPVTMPHDTNMLFDDDPVNISAPDMLRMDFADGIFSDCVSA